MVRIFLPACLVALPVASFLAAPTVAADRHYPKTRRVDQVDVYHGVRVADPYRWLEQDVRKSEEVAGWVAAENDMTFPYLESIPERARIRQRLTEPYGMPIDLIDNFDDEYCFVGNEGSELFFETDRAAPRKRLIAIDVHKPERANWKEIIPQADNTLTDVGFVGNLFVAHYLKDACTQTRISSIDGRFWSGIWTGTFHNRRSEKADRHLRSATFLDRLFATTHFTDHLNITT